MATVYEILVPELQTDPLTRGYAGMTDAQRLASLTAVNRPGTDREIVPSHEIIEATVAADWSALTAAEKQRYQTIVGAGSVNLKGANTRAALGAIFGAGTTTRANLLALQAGPRRSRAEELGIVNLGLGHLESAREQIGG